MSRLRANFGAALSGTAVSQILAGIAQVLIVRTLGATQYGTYALLYAWLAIVSAIIGAGLDLWLLDYGSRHPTRIQTALRQIMLIKISLVIVCGVIVLCGLLPLQVAPTLMLLGLLAVTADSLSASMWQSLRALNQHRTVAIIQSGTMLGVLLAVLAGAATSVYTMLVAQACIAVGGVIISWRMSRPVVMQQHDPVSLQSGVPFVISDVCAQLYTYSGTLLLAQVVDVMDVGIYRGAWSIIGYSFVIPAVILSTTLPQLNAATTAHARRHIMGVAAGLYTLYGISMVVVAYAIAPRLLPWLYGQSFAASATLVPQLAFIPMAKALSFWGATVLIHQRRLQARIAVQISVVTLLWLMAPPLIATAGIHGAITTQLWCEGLLAFGYISAALWGIRLGPAVHTPPQHIYISNMHGVGNVGDLAIHQAQLAMLQQRFPGAQFTLAYADRSGAQRVFPQHRIVNGLSHWVYDAHGQIAPLATRMRRLLALTLAIPVLRWGGHAHVGLTVSEQATLAALAAADLVCASGGGYLYDTPQRAGFWRWLSWDWYLLADMGLAVILGRPLVLLPQSFGPIHSRWLRAAVRAVAQRAQHVYARESWSSAWLTQHNIPHSVASDLAWRMRQPHQRTHNTPAILGITVIDWGAQYAGFMGQDAYEQLVCAVIQHYVADSWQVRLFVQCHDSNPAWDDARVAKRIQTRIAHPDVQVMPFIADPHELQQTYARLDRLLTTRLHAAILRLACNQPTVVLAYLPKATGMMHDIGLAPWCLAIATHDVQDVLTALASCDDQLPYLSQRQYIATVFESVPSAHPSSDPR